MPKIAIDVILMLPEDIVDTCTEINKKSFDNNKGRFRLSKTDFIPHVSLTLGFIEERTIDSIKSAVREIAERTNHFEVKITGLLHFERKDGRRASLSIEVAPELKSLHESILGEVAEFLVHCESSDALFEGEKTGMSDTTKLILNNYREKYSGDNYKPHITLGCYDAEPFCTDIKFPIHFDARKVALCLVGNGGTCRKILFSTNLQ